MHLIVFVWMVICWGTLWCRRRCFFFFRLHLFSSSSLHDARFIERMRGMTRRGMTNQSRWAQLMDARGVRREGGARIEVCTTGEEQHARSPLTSDRSQWTAIISADSVIYIIMLPTRCLIVIFFPLASIGIYYVCMYAVYDSKPRLRDFNIDARRQRKNKYN